MDKSKKIAVVYLMWLPYGQAHLQSFAQSYLTFPAGHEHVLYILFNGSKSREDVAGCLDILDSCQISYQVLEIPQGQDITAYLFAADTIAETYILFLNTYSRFLHPEWLAKYWSAITSSPSIGLVGATASCQSYYSSVFETHSLGWETQHGFAYNIRKYKLFIKTIGYWYFLFKPFPAPHIRTNAFMIERDVFKQLADKPIDSKLKAYRFESGRKSMTSQVLKMGLQTVVIDRWGQIHQITSCKYKPIFWNGNQEDLLVSDNQTTLYQEADAAKRKFLNKLAWGIND